MTEKTCPAPEPFKAMIWNILFLTLIFCLSFISRFIFAPLMPFIGVDLGLTHGQAGSIFLIGSVGLFAGSISAGFISVRINHRGNLILSTFGVGFVLLICAIWGSLWAIRISMLTLGIAAGLNLPSNMATITAMVSRQDWGKALALQQMAPPMSLILGPLLAVVFTAWFSWRIPLAFLGLLSIGVGLAFTRAGQLGNFQGDRPKVSLFRVVLAHRSFWLMVILFALGMGGQVGVYAMLPLFLVTERGMDADLANTLIGLSQISALFMTFFAGWVTDKIGEKRAIVLFLMCSGIVTILMGLLSGPWLKAIIFIQPALIVCFFPAGFAALARIVQTNIRSLATAWATPTAFILGGGVFPAALGFMSETFSFGLGISLAGCVIAVGSLLAHFLDLIEDMEEGC
jgi:NNP family nitrate/nitrite transporter-like MFS transporter